MPSNSHTFLRQKIVSVRNNSADEVHYQFLFSFFLLRRIFLQLISVKKNNYYKISTGFLGKRSEKRRTATESPLQMPVTIFNFISTNMTQGGINVRPTPDLEQGILTF